MDFSVVFERWDYFERGIVLTLEITAISLVIGAVLAVVLALASVYGHRSLGRAVGAFTYVFRGSPLLIQLFLIYYGLGQFEVVRESWAWAYLRDAYWCAVLAFSLNSGAYTTEILIGAIRAMPKGEIEACIAYGMSKWQTIRRVVLPSSLRRSFPAYTNEVIFTMHGSALASVVTLTDILGAARQVNAETYTSFPGYITAAVLYTLITLVLVQVFKLAEKRYFAHLAR